MIVGEEIGKSKFVLVSTVVPTERSKRSKHKWKLVSAFQLSYLLDAMSNKKFRNLD